MDKHYFTGHTDVEIGDKVLYCGIETEIFDISTTYYARSRDMEWKFYLIRFGWVNREDFEYPIEHK